MPYEQLVDSVDKARENNIDDIDGILYAIDCATDNDSPFAGIFRRIDGMYTLTDRRRAYLLKHSTSLQSQDSETKSIEGARPRVNLSVGGGQMSNMLMQTNHEFGVVTTAETGAGACASSERASHNASSGSVGMPMVALNDKGLAVRTTRSPKNESMQDLHQCVTTPAIGRAAADAPRARLTTRCHRARTGRCVTPSHRSTWC